MEATTTVTRDEEFYMALVSVKVENVLFRLPAGQLMAQSEHFHEKLSTLHAPTNCNGNGGNSQALAGSSDEFPIILTGVKADDFKSLLKCVYPRNLGVIPNLSKIEWIGVHYLAHHFRMAEILEASKSFLFNMDDFITKIEIGARFKYAEWRLKAFEELVYRQDPLTIDEIRRIGLEAATQITRIREVRLKSMSRLRLTTEWFGRNYNEHCAFCKNQIKIDNDTKQCQTCNIVFYTEDKQVDEILPVRLKEMIAEVLGVTAKRESDAASADDATKSPQPVTVEDRSPKRKR
ncbi:hypothetical protein SCHPADRAFT_943485 [Schizopora paradoxa]|uniref:BTB domain-containing protein n=1 Tax=Schizopora paradoxa TaxID=27342 RepID=A0A0H2RCQ9_9AGAM|nr:hypothetical protein SCHPADRAFT_943485 [Schizopora paradoxa]